VSFLQAGSGAVVRTAQSKMRDVVSVKDFGAVGDGVADDYAAIMAAINSETYGTGFYVSGPAVYFPPGTYYCSQTIQLKKSVRLYGDGSGLPSSSTATLKFPGGKTGIIVQRYNTIDNTIQSPATTGGDASIIEGLRFIGGIGAPDVYGGHCIWLRARAVIRNVYIQSFTGNGLHIVASSGAGGAAEGNANNFYVDTGRIQLCEHGIFVDGADANAGYVGAVDVTSNRRWGVWDSSFLGNTYVAIHADSNGYYAAGGVSAFASFGGSSYQAAPTATASQLVTTQPGTNSAIWYPIAATSYAIAWTGSQPAGTYRSGGPFYTDSLNARNVFLGCYVESGHGASWFSTTGISVGGSIGAVATGTDVQTNTVGMFVNTAFVTSKTSSAGKTVTITTGGDPGNGDVLQWNHSDDTSAWPWRLRRSGADYVIDNANLRTAAYITGQNTTLQFGSSATVPYLMGFPTIGLGSGFNARRQTTGSAAPTTGAWAQGDIVWNISPTSGGFAGWICTVAGTPGTWRTFGLIS